jgi:hypothetical protein
MSEMDSIIVMTGTVQKVVGIMIGLLELGFVTQCLEIVFICWLTVLI